MRVGRNPRAQATLGDLRADSARIHGLAPAERALLIGMTYADHGRFQDAKPHLDAATELAPAFADYALYYRGRVALALGDAATATHMWETLVQIYPQSRLAGLTEEALAEAAAARGDLDGASIRLQTLLQQTASPWRARRLRELAATLALRAGDRGDATARYQELYRSARYPGEVERARAGLTAANGHSGRGDPLSGWPAAERVALADAFLERGLAAEAVVLLEALGGAGAERLATAYFKARNYAKAYPLFARLVERGSSTMDSITLLQRTAQAAARAGQYAPAIALQERIIAEAPSGRVASQARYKRAFLLQDMGNCQAAVPAYRAWLDDGVRAGAAVPDVLWAIAWCHYQQRAWPTALSALDELAVLAPDTLTQARVAYWRARVQEAAGDRGGARDAFAQVAASYGGTYYGTLAATRLRGAHAQEQLFRQRPDTHGPSEAPPVDGAEPVASLLRLGLWDYALDETDRAVGSRVGLTPLHEWAMYYLGRRWGLDPALVRVVMRQESGFRADVVSPAGAIGLLQLMPATAQRMADELQLRDFRDEDLFRTQLNLRLGMWYLRSLLQRYRGQLPLALAAYNAGEAAVDRWREQHPSAPLDEFIEMIPYEETHNYVKRILRMYW